MTSLTVGTFGGYGQAAVGRHQYGAPASVLEPRYNVSIPTDEQQEVSTSQWITFSTYFYSSVPDFPDGIQIEVSENNSISFEDAVLPKYELVKRVLDGQRIWFKIRKITGAWPPATFIVIRYTGPDEHGNLATKIEPIRWE